VNNKRLIILQRRNLNFIISKIKIRYNKVDASQKTQIGQLELIASDNGKKLSNIMKDFIENVNTNNKSAFKIRINTDLHLVNGPNAYPIVVESKKKSKNSTMWESDCCECRMDTDSGTSSGNILFANYKKNNSSRENVVENKKTNKRLIKGSLKNNVNDDEEEVKHGSNDKEDDSNSRNDNIVKDDEEEVKHGSNDEDDSNNIKSNMDEDFEKIDLDELFGNKDNEDEKQNNQTTGIIIFKNYLNYYL
jgi:hypothetical protein